MSAAKGDGAGTGDRDHEEALLALLVEQAEEDEEDEPDGRRLWPLRLVQGDDDVVAETSADHDHGRWSAEELAMHLVDEP